MTNVRTRARNFTRSLHLSGLGEEAVTLLFPCKRQVRANNVLDQNRALEQRCARTHTLQSSYDFLLLTVSCSRQMLLFTGTGWRLQTGLAKRSRRSGGEMRGQGIDSERKMLENTHRGSCYRKSSRSRISRQSLDSSDGSGDGKRILDSKRFLRLFSWTADDAH